MISPAVGPITVWVNSSTRMPASGVAVITPSFPRRHCERSEAISCRLRTWCEIASSLRSSQ
jgi:hypothetical protein